MGGPKVPYSELSEEKKEEIRQRHAEHAAEEGREYVDDETYHEGTLLKRSRCSGWIKPSNPATFPAQVKKKLREMTAAQKKRAIERGTMDSFNDGVIYLRMCDVVEGVKVEPDMELLFKVYIDNEGVGAYEVTSLG